MTFLIRIMNHESCLAGLACRQTGRQVRIMIFVLFMILASLFMIHPVYAQANSTPAQQSTWEESKPTSQVSQSLTPIPFYVPPTSPLYTDLLINNLFHSFSCLAIGQSVIGQPCLTYQITKNAQGAIRSVPMLSSVNLSGGTLGAITGVIGALYQNPPVRTADYLASVGQSFGIAKEAHAQVGGSGAGVLSPILTLWQVSRNISYVIMILIFVIIGVMVMFRSKINPQTVITAQAAIPGLVIGLILITFSYFLAGLVSDMAFVGTNVVGYYFSAAQPGSTPKLVSDISRDNAGSIFSKYVGTFGTPEIAGVIGPIFDSLDASVKGWIRLFAGLIGFMAGQSFGAPIGSLGGALICTSTGIGILGAPLCAVVAGLAGGLAGGLALATPAAADPTGTFSLVLFFVAVAILIYTMFKLLLKLITVYLNIIFFTITAPFQFLFASLPGRQGIATGWILTMLGNVLVFPVVFAVFYFVGYLLGPDSWGGRFFGIKNQFNPSGNQTFPLLGGIDLSFIRTLLAFGALLATPTIPDVIIRAIGKASQAGQLIGQEISGGTRSGQGYAGQLGNRAGGTVGSIGKTFGGETQYRWDEVAGTWVAYTGTAGIFGPRGIRTIIGKGRSTTP